VGRDPQALLGEPATLELLAVADPADHGVICHLDVSEPDRRVPVRVVVGELGVVDVRDPVGAWLDQEQRRQLLVAVEDVAMTTSTRATSPEVTNHFSPLIRQPASVLTAVVAIVLGSDPASAR